MGSIPAFLLKKLYVKGSLKNTSNGFELTIQNTLAPGTIVGLGPLQVDGVEYPLEQTRVILPDGRSVSVAEISAQEPMRFAVGDKVTIQVEGAPLAAGAHKVMISPKTKEAGVLEIPAEDTIV
ncbi:MAG: hydroxymethylglutaryl-CoA reductase [Anaerolineae bacterium]